MTSQQDRDGSRMHGMRRREFLVLGAVGAAGIATMGSASELVSAPKPYAIGYSPLLPSMAGDAASAMERIVPAETLRQGDDAFRGGSARVTIHGFWRSQRERDQRVSVGVAALYPLAGGTTAPVLAWSNPGARASVLNVPLDQDGALILDFQMREPLALLQNGFARRFANLVDVTRANSKDKLLEAPVETRYRLMTGGASGAPKLRRGTYVVAFRSAIFDAAPAWSSLRLATVNGRITRDGAPLQRATALGLRSADEHDYLLFSVDHPIA